MGEPLLHMFNKTAAFFGDDIKRLVKGCRVSLLLGDGVGDATMAEGLGCRTTLKVGFLNEKVDERFPEFDKVFDAIVTKDGPVPEACFRAVGHVRWPAAKQVRGLCLAGTVVAAYISIAILS